MFDKPYSLHEIFPRQLRDPLLKPAISLKKGTVTKGLRHEFGEIDNHPFEFFPGNLTVIRARGAFMGIALPQLSKPG